jgi:nitroreductase
MPEMTAEEMLTTTRAVRKRLDFSRPVEPGLIRECLEIALQAPTGGNAQGWHFVLVTDAGKRASLAELYRRSFATYADSPRAPNRQEHGDPARMAQQQRVMDSAAYLAEHIHEAPVHLIPCLSGRGANVQSAPLSQGASLYPAVWSFMLAARLRGLGTCLTTLHLAYEEEAAEVLGIPYDKVSQGGLIPVAHTKGTEFKTATRQPLDEVLHLEDW